MRVEQLIGKFARLRWDLAAAYECPAWNKHRGAQIVRIAQEIAETEQLLMKSLRTDEQAQDSFLGFTGQERDDAAGHSGGARRA